MPFKSSSQRRLCYLLKKQGRAGSWDCSKWSKHTKSKSLPKYAKKKK